MGATQHMYNGFKNLGAKTCFIWLCLEDTSLHVVIIVFFQVLISENPKSFSHFITNVCAIIGGVFTVYSILFFL